MAKIFMGPCGNVIKGHVLDVNQKAFDETLQFYDRQLYTKWNPKKLQGHGCWEIRRKPEYLSALDVSEYEGNLIFKIGPKEFEHFHHVLDCAFLNYDALRKLQEIDTWTVCAGDVSKYEEEVNRRTRDRKEREKELALNERRAMTKYFRKEIGQFREMIKSGVNPALLAQYWDSAREAD